WSNRGLDKDRFEIWPDIEWRTPFRSGRSLQPYEMDWGDGPGRLLVEPFHSDGQILHPAIRRHEWWMFEAFGRKKVFGRATAEVRLPKLVFQSQATTAPAPAPGQSRPGYSGKADFS